MKVLFVNLPRHDGLPVIREDRCEIVNRYLVNPPSINDENRGDDHRRD